MDCRVLTASFRLALILFVEIFVEILLLVLEQIFANTCSVMMIFLLVQILVSLQILTSSVGVDLRLQAHKHLQSLVKISTANFYY